MKKEETQEQTNHEEEIANLNNKLLRVLADYQNLQRQTATQVESMRVSSISDIVKGMSEIYDDLQLAIQNMDESARPGVQSILEKIKKIITEQGCEVIAPNTGEDFDAGTMEAITQIETKDDKQINKIAQLVSVGIKYNENILKPARVITYKK